jgi:hypothetical protein
LVALQIGSAFNGGSNSTTQSLNPPFQPFTGMIGIVQEEIDAPKSLNDATPSLDRSFISTEQIAEAAYTTDDLTSAEAFNEAFPIVNASNFCSDRKIDRLVADYYTNIVLKDPLIFVIEMYAAPVALATTVLSPVKKALIAVSIKLPPNFISLFDPGGTRLVTTSPPAPPDCKYSAMIRTACQVFAEMPKMILRCSNSLFCLSITTGRLHEKELLSYDALSSRLRTLMMDPNLTQRISVATHGSVNHAYTRFERFPDREIVVWLVNSCSWLCTTS